MSGHRNLLAVVGLSLFLSGYALEATVAAPSATFTQTQIASFIADPAAFLASLTPPNKPNGQPESRNRAISSWISQLVQSDPSNSALLNAITGYAATSSQGVQFEIGKGLGEAAASLTASGDTTDGNAVQLAAAKAAAAGDQTLASGFSSGSNSVATAATGATGGAGGTTGGGVGGPTTGLGQSGGTGGGAGGTSGTGNQATTNSSPTSGLAGGSGSSVSTSF